LTDICAFSAGIITVFPGLQAFCISCALGIAAIYLLQITWFVAWLVIYERRKKKETTEASPKCVDQNCSIPRFSATKCHISKKIWPAFSNLLDSKIYHLVVLVVSCTFLSVGIWGCLTIKQEIELSKFYPSDSYLRRWFDEFHKNFKNWDVGFVIYTSILETKEDFVELDKMTNTLSGWIENEEILESMDNWWEQFKYHIAEYWNITEWKKLFDSNDGKDVQYYISEFLYSPNGGKYIANLRFNETLTCQRPSPIVMSSAIPISYIKSYNSTERNQKRNILENFINSLNTTEKTFSYGYYYFVWDANEFVGIELWRNLGVAMLCIFVVTLLLLNDFLASLLVNVSVLISVVNVVGFVRFWDITIDNVSLCTIVVVVGICVDYPVHVIHGYLIASGNYNVVV
jgi:predicted RND superfamily exporter protein